MATTTAAKRWQAADCMVGHSIPALPRRSPGEWVVRVVLAIIVAAAGYVSVMHPLALTMRRTAVERAHALAPWEGRITALVSEKLSDPSAAPINRALASRVAKIALSQDPTVVSAVATLGLDAQIKGDTKTARRLFTYSDTLSRRDLRTRLWLLEDAVARNDVPSALQQYDIALRTSRFASDLLFPILTSAINDPEILSALVRKLAEKPAWMHGFFAYLASTGNDADAMARLFTTLNQIGVITSDEINATALERLVASGSYDQAWSFYSQIRRNSDRRRSRDPKFALRTASPTVFDWSPNVSESAISVSLQEGAADFASPPSVGGWLLQQTQFLPPGRYILDGRSIGIDQPTKSLPYWTLVCANGRELGRVAVPNSNEANGRFKGEFTVIAGCSIQYLQLVAKPSSLISGISGRIIQVNLRPAN